ncbi:hypothetical protein L484_022544 [Morus notabilis]|uniref:Uncharacterized protein n=1 Tax=Morus notabilis TaxID=981085 RepID=W9RGZ0_9ROSA|nr:hypothetical protein L484_022544 [Morus notabilis]
MVSLQGGNGEKGKRKGMYTGKTTKKRCKDGKLKINFDEVTLRAIGHNHGRFDFVMLPDIKKVIDDQMKDSHRSWRCSLRKYFKKIGGEISPEIAKRLPPDDIINYEDWEWLCDYWSTEEQVELSKQNMKNRLTNKGYNSSHGSKSYPAHREELNKMLALRGV